MSIPTHITVNLNERMRSGVTQIVCRMHTDDTDDMLRAARVLSISREEFIRTVAIQAARKILAEAGK